VHSTSKHYLSIAFIEPSEGAIGGPPASEEWFAKIEKEVLEKLEELYPDIEFKTYKIKSVKDVNEFLKKESGSLGYVVFILNCIAGFVRPIFFSGKPTIAIAETYGGSGELLLEYSRALKNKLPIVGVVSRNVADEGVLRKIGLLETMFKLKKTKALFIVSPSEKYLLSLEYPLSIHLYSALRDIQAIAGITPVVLNAKDFISEYYNVVDEAEARKIAEKWVKEASENLEPDFSEVVKSAKLYIAMKNAAKDYEANMVAIDCIVLRNTGILDAWPCLGFMELWNDGIMPVCEADPYSAVAILIGKYLAGVNGFVVDVAVDMLKNEVIYYHCYAPLNPHGIPREKYPYTITTAHLGVKHASVSVKLPVNETVTAVGLIPDERVFVIHTAEIVNVEYSNYACSVKLVGKANVKAISKKWPWKSGWHRVILYGDLRNELKELATLLGLKVLEEDKDAL